MFKKRYLFILVPVVLLVVTGAIVGIKRVSDEYSPLVEVCRNDLASTGYTSPAGYSVYTCGSKEFHMLLKYQSTIFRTPTSVIVRFNDGVNFLDCEMQRRGSEWVVTSRGTTIAGICP